MKKRLFLLFQSLSMAYSPSSSQHFTNKIYVKALEAYNESLTTERDDTFTPIQRVGILCNIATTHFMMSEFEESESHFQRALVEADSSGKYCWDIKALIMSKLAYVLYKREFYNRAYDLYSEGEFLSDCSYDFFATIMPRQINITTSCYSSLKPKLHLFNRRTRALSRDAKDVLKCVEFSS
jgi:tetratricopeptide (TPR) repeat protein